MIIIIKIIQLTSVKGKDKLSITIGKFSTFIVLRMLKITEETRILFMFYIS